VVIEKSYNLFEKCRDETTSKWNNKIEMDLRELEWCGFVLLRQGPTESLCCSDRDRQSVCIAQTGTDRKFVLLRQGPTESLCCSDREIGRAHV
jgi:hypothetical protein